MNLIQVRNVPEDVHRRLKVRAAERGITLSALVYDAVLDYAERPTMTDFRAQVATREPVECGGHLAHSRPVVDGRFPPDS